MSSYSRLHGRLRTIKALNKARVSGDRDAVWYAQNKLTLMDIACGYKKPNTVVFQLKRKHDQA